MKKILTSVIALSFIICLSPKAEAFSLLGVRAGAGVGTTGITGEVGYRGFWGDRIGLRAQYNYLKFDFSGEYDNIEYDLEPDFQSVGGLIDLYPFTDVPFLGGFRLSGGYFSTDYQLDMHARPTGTYQIGDSSYAFAAGDQVNSRVEWDNGAPYAGIGLDMGIIAGLKVTSDIGAMFVGDPEVNVTVTGPAVSQADLDREEQKIEDDLEVANIHPVVRLGLAYVF